MGEETRFSRVYPRLKVTGYCFYILNQLKGDNSRERMTYVKVRDLEHLRSRFQRLNRQPPREVVLLATVQS